MNSRIPCLATLEEGTIDPGNCTQNTKQADDNDITSHRGTMSDVGQYEKRSKKRLFTDTRYPFTGKT